MPYKHDIGHHEAAEKEGGGLTKSGRRNVDGGPNGTTGRRRRIKLDGNN